MGNWVLDYKCVPPVILLLVWCGIEFAAGKHRLRAQFGIVLADTFEPYGARVNAIEEQYPVKGTQVPIDTNVSTEIERSFASAVSVGDLQLVKEILAKSPRLASSAGFPSPLRIAATRGHIEICRYLIDSFGVAVDDSVRGRGYPIIIAALPFPEIVELLIDHGADVKARIRDDGSHFGQLSILENATALHYAARDGDPESIRILIDHVADIFAVAYDVHDKSRRQSALDVAAEFCDTENVAALVEHPAFGLAVIRRRQSAIDNSLLIAMGCSRYARKISRVSLIKLLLEKGANPALKVGDVTIMQTAANRMHLNHERDNIEILQRIELLAEHGAPIDLFTAAAIGDRLNIALLTRANHELVDFRGPNGYPALHFAVKMNYLSITKMLLKGNRDLSIRNESKCEGHPGETALHTAAYWDRYEIAELLTDMGADVNAVTNRKSTPLHFAAQRSTTKLVKLLLERGAQPEAQDCNGETPLELCLKTGRPNSDEVKTAICEHRK